MERCQSSTNNFRWPGDEDSLPYNDDEILCAIEPPCPNGTFYRDELVYTFSSEIMKKISEFYASYKEKIKMKDN